MKGKMLHGMSSLMRIGFFLSLAKVSLLAFRNVGFSISRPDASGRLLYTYVSFRVVFKRTHQNHVTRLKGLERRFNNLNNRHKASHIFYLISRLFSKVAHVIC